MTIAIPMWLLYSVATIGVGLVLMLALFGVLVLISIYNFRVWR